jgi:hypothetical protein
MAQSYSFFQGIPANIPETDCIEIASTIAADVGMHDIHMDTSSYYGIDDVDDDAFGTTPEPYCKCGNAYCSVNSMSSVQKLQIQRTRDFHEFFPDLFLDNVHPQYSVPDIYNSFESLGNNIVSSIIIVPCAQFNQFVVKFNTFNIPKDTYDRTICTRLPFYIDSLSGEPDTRRRWFEFVNVAVFNPVQWYAEERFGVEHQYSIHDHSILYNDPRTVHLYQYLKNTHFSCRLSDDTVHLLTEENARAEQDAIYDIHGYLSGKDYTNADAAAAAELEDGEIDESHLYENNDYVLNYLNNNVFYHDTSLDHNYVNDYIYGIAENTTHNHPQGLSIIENVVNTPSLISSDISECDDYALDEDLYSSEDEEDDHECYPQDDSDEEDYEDPDELHYRINNTTNPHDRAHAFWN